MDGVVDLTNFINGVAIDGELLLMRRGRTGMKTTIDAIKKLNQLISALDQPGNFVLEAKTPLV